MKRILLTVVLVGLLAGQASAGMYTLDHDTARQFRQLNTPNQFTNQLYLVIDSPGTLGSTVRWAVDPSYDTYGLDMQLDVGFVGQLKDTETMTIGLRAGLPTPPVGVDPYDSFGSFIANDDDDLWAANLYVIAGATTYESGMIQLAPHTALFFATPTFAGTVSEFGFKVDYLGDKGSDNFHMSVVPVPAALILGLLGMGAAGLRLRRFA